MSEQNEEGVRPKLALIPKNNLKTLKWVRNATADTTRGDLRGMYQFGDALVATEGFRLQVAKWPPRRPNLPLSIEDNPDEHINNGYFDVETSKLGDSGVMSVSQIPNSEARVKKTAKSLSDLINDKPETKAFITLDLSRLRKLITHMEGSITIYLGEPHQPARIAGTVDEHPVFAMIMPMHLGSQRDQSEEPKRWSPSFNIIEEDGKENDNESE